MPGQDIPEGKDGTVNYKWIGAALVFLACGGFGFSVAGAYRREIAILRQIEHMTNLMESELTYRLTPLPELCRKVGKAVGGITRRVLESLAQELEYQVRPDVSSCMHSALACVNSVPRSAERIYSRLGTSLGQYDLSGQLQGLASVRQNCTCMLQRMEENRDQRIRGYQTLGLCAGLALVILFI